ADLILKDNYRSVLAAQRMKESLERIDSGAVFMLLGRGDEGRAQIAANQQRFESELVVEEHNITEPGELEAAQALRAGWQTYVGKVQAFEGAAPDAQAMQYFAELQPQFNVVKDGADAILGINQDAMVRKRDQTLRSAARVKSAMLFAAIGACCL